MKITINVGEDETLAKPFILGAITEAVKDILEKRHEGEFDVKDEKNSTVEFVEKK